MKTPVLFFSSIGTSAGEGRPDQVSVTPLVGAAYIIESVAAIVCAALASAIVVTAIALVIL